MAKDKIHNAVKNALIKDGWTILADPFYLKYEEFQLLADLAAERPLLAERNAQRIVVEIKTFGERSFVKALQQALGQYEIYYDLLTENALGYDLYLGISDVVHDTFFEHRVATQLIVRRRHMKFVVVDIDEEVIVQWIH